MKKGVQKDQISPNTLYFSPAPLWSGGSSSPPCGLDALSIPPVVWMLLLSPMCSSSPPCGLEAPPLTPVVWRLLDKFWCHFGPNLSNVLRFEAIEAQT